MILYWFTLFLYIFGASGNQHQGFGKYPRTLDKNKVHQSLNIINGNKTSVAKYPFIASLQVQQAEFGAALILNERWLLTTGYTVAWVALQDILFRVGSNSYSRKGQVLKASQVISHPRYTGSWDYDIAVVKTDKPIKFNKKVRSITLGTSDLKGGAKAYVAGWGMRDITEATPSDVLLAGEVTVLDWEQCAKIYGGNLTSRLMCTFDKTAGPGVYDYGAPLIVDNILYGLYAGGYDCKPGAYPVLYTDIPALTPWVNSVITNDEDSD